MISPSQRQDLSPLAITAPVREVLNGRHGPARVLGRYRSGANVLIGEQVVYVCDRPIPSAAGLRVETSALRTILHGADIGRIDPSRAELEPTRITAAIPSTERISGLIALITEEAGTSWFATTPAELSGIEAVDQLARGIRAAERHAVIAALQRLVGRGIGLTPSGDDAITGVLAAAIGTGQLDPATTVAIRAWLATEGPQRTTSISLTTLRCAADGHFSPSLRTLIMAAGTDDPDHDHELVAEVAAHGHTSGRDALYGVARYWQQVHPADLPSSLKTVPEPTTVPEPIRS